LSVSVDGKDVELYWKANYSGYLPAGQHVITARVDPNPAGSARGERP